MVVPVVDVRVMGMTVYEARVPVRVNVGLGPIPGEIVFVPVVLVVRVAVRVFQRIVQMLVGMAFADMQPDARRRQRQAQPEQCAGDFAQRCERQ